MTKNIGDPLQVAGNVYKLVMENDRVRVMKATFQPGAKAVMHEHPDHVIYMLQGGKAKLTNAEGKTDVLDLKTGDAVFLKAQAHEAQNIGQAPRDILVVELKK